MSLPEIISAGAAVVSAIGGGFAALAAFRSAASARATQQSAAAAEHRAALRQIGQTATEVVIEGQRVAERANYLKSAYGSLFVFAGQSGGSRQARYDLAVDEKIKRASDLCDYAKVFTSISGKLDDAPPEETDRVQTNLSSALTEIRALREDLERELAGADGQSASYRDRVLKGEM